MVDPFRASRSRRAMRRRRVAVITNSLASTDSVPVHSKYGRYRKPQLPAGVRLQASAPFRARPEVRFVHNGDVHFCKPPCLRRENPWSARSRRCNYLRSFRPSAILGRNRCHRDGASCSEVRNHVRMRRESELLASRRIQERRLRKRAFLISSIARKRVLY